MPGPRERVSRVSAIAAAALFVCLMPMDRIAAQESDQAAASEIESFERRIRPILVRRCYECHSAQAKTLHGGLRVDTAAGLMSGGDSGPAVVPHEPDASLLITAVQYAPDADVQMPPKGRLPDREIQALIEWVRRGAAFPGAAEMPSTREEIDWNEARAFWSFRPLQSVALPDVSRPDWPASRIDYFVLSAMEREGLTPTPEADRRTLLRRLSFDMIGLPPSPEEVAVFVADTQPGAWERQVDRLLDSPHFGERWGRVWLDLARYTDKTANWLNPTGTAHLYRDWVVRAMNDDVPYDKFIRRQLATDLMEETGPDDMPALGFLGLSPNYWKELKLPAEIIRVIVADEWEERVDAVSRTFLGLTVACARCHDHKFDPITTQDYYALAGVFASTRMIERPIIDEKLFAPVRAAREKVAELQKQIDALSKKKPKPEDQIKQLTQRAESIRSSTPHYDTPTVPAVAEESLYVERLGKRAQDGTRLVYRAQPRNLPLFIRGNPNRHGPVVPRGFLRVLSQPQRTFSQGSGRLELADAITSDAAPLAARVIVNRIWREHFGEGLVRTPSNLGQSGERPSHPELLEDLAARFVSSGWSLKRLHRELVLSAAYRQRSRSETSERIDPENRWLSRMNRRRLPVESWRDAMLSVTGELDLTIGGPSLSLSAQDNVRRTLYATVHRRDMSTMLLTHDFPDPTSHSPQRVSTTTALQGLYALNGPLLLDRAAALAKRMTAEPDKDLTSRVRETYEFLFSRAPTGRELMLAETFLRDCRDEAVAWKQYAHVLLASNEFLFVD